MLGNKKRLALTMLTLAAVINIFAIGVRTAIADSPTTNTVVDDVAIKRKINVLKSIWSDVEANPLGSEKRKEFLTEYLSKSEIVRTLPTDNPAIPALWTLRATAAYELGNKRTSWEAGQAMIKLGLDRSDNEMIVKTIALLERKGLLDTSTGEGKVFAEQAVRLKEARSFANPVDALKAYKILDKLIADAPDYTEAFALSETLSPWLPKDAKKTIVNSIHMQFARIPAGTFKMGSPEGEESHQPNETQHTVTLTKTFYMGVYHVTVSEFDAFVKDTGYNVAADGHDHSFLYPLVDKGNGSFRDPGFVQGADHPAVMISYDDAIAYIAWLNNLPAEKAAERHYRLPTEAEWEYACRAGTTTPFTTGETINTEQANYNGHIAFGSGKEGVYRKETTPVGKFPANSWGLYDMHGNALQWCADWYGPGARVVRGGSWCSSVPQSRSAYRGYNGNPTGRYNDTGFRVVID
jgi:sulfatase modifying factor 1